MKQAKKLDKYDKLTNYIAMMKKQTKAEIFEFRMNLIKAILVKELSAEHAEQLAVQLMRGAGDGNELNDFDDWLNNRFIPQLVWLDSEDYTRAITRALPQALAFAATDFGGSRQRDLGQLWTDTARGFLGEIAFKKFMKENYNIDIEHDISMGKPLSEYISSDIKSVVKDGSSKVSSPKVNVSIKTGKFNARWMDEYTAGKTKTIDIFVFVRAGTVREHFIAFLKAISFLGTKLFPAAERLGELTKVTRKTLWDSIPEFQSVPAYITGYLIQEELNLPIHSLNCSVVGKKNRRILITEGVGNFSIDVLREDKRIKKIDPDGKMTMVINGIGNEINEKPHFYANTGSLLFGKNNWQRFIKLL